MDTPVKINSEGVRRGARTAPKWRQFGATENNRECRRQNGASVASNWLHNVF